MEPDYRLTPPPALQVDGIYVGLGHTADGCCEAIPECARQTCHGSDGTVLHDAAKNIGPREADRSSGPGRWAMPFPTRATTRFSTSTLSTWGRCAITRRAWPWRVFASGAYGQETAHISQVTDIACP